MLACSIPDSGQKCESLCYRLKSRVTIKAGASQVSLVLPTVQDQLGIGTLTRLHIGTDTSIVHSAALVCTIISWCCAGNTYLVFAGIAVVALLTIYLTVPETKGKTLEEIESMFASGGKGE